MKRILVLCLVFVCALVPMTVKAEWQDPFSCDPYIFPFDFAGGYDSIVIPMLIRSNLAQDQQLTVSMWPEYAGGGAAPSGWFTIEPQNAILPANGIAAFNIKCQPYDYEEKVYLTYLKVARTIDGQNYWERPLTVRVRFGSAIPVIEYNVEGWKCASIAGNEGTGYTQDQIGIKITNKSFTPNSFALFPVTPSIPGTDNIQTESASYRKLIDLWRDPTAVAVYPEPQGTVNPQSGKYDRYTLYYLKGDKKVEFGEFLAASYTRDNDILQMSIYPYTLPPRDSRDIPFVLRVKRSVPTGIYRLQVHVGPCGDSYIGVGMSTQYQCKIALEISRTEGVSWHSFVWMILAAGGLAVGGLAYVGWTWLQGHKQILIPSRNGVRSR